MKRLNHLSKIGKIGQKQSQTNVQRHENLKSDLSRLENYSLTENAKKLRIKCPGEMILFPKKTHSAKFPAKRLFRNEKHVLVSTEIKKLKREPNSDEKLGKSCTVLEKNS